MMRKFITCGTVFLVTAILLIACFALLLLFAMMPDVYETNNLADYGKYTGNYDNEAPREFINSFFPETLSDSFADVTYHYKAKRFDTYAYEAYLEFVIPDSASFNLFIEEYIEKDQCTPFMFDTSFTEYSISNVLEFTDTNNHADKYAISYAEIGKILFSTDEQRIIFVALGVYDGGGTYTSELNWFFSRFNIDCQFYQQNAYFTHADQRNGILFKDR